MEERLVKVYFQLEGSDWHNYKTESVWALQLKGDLFQIRNIPTFMYGVSLNDICFCELKEGGLYYYKYTVKPSGHSTYRIFLPKNFSRQAFEVQWAKMEKFDCKYEKSTELLYSVDIPAISNIYAVYAMLEEGEKNGTWYFEEAHCGHAVN